MNMLPSSSTHSTISADRHTRRTFSNCNIMFQPSSLSFPLRPQPEHSGRCRQPRRQRRRPGDGVVEPRGGGGGNQTNIIGGAAARTAERESIAARSSRVFYESGARRRRENRPLSPGITSVIASYSHSLTRIDRGLKSMQTESEKMSLCL